MSIKKLYILFSMLFCMFDIKVFAYDIAVQNDDGVTIYYNYVNNATELEVTNLDTSGNSYSGVVVIPEEVAYNNTIWKVTRIRNGAFFHCRNLTSVTIPNNVTYIGRTAFYGCSALTSINIPNGVTMITMSTFAYCSSLTSITIPSSVTSIGGSAFEGCYNLISITIPDSATIGGRAFSGCTRLSSINIPSTVTRIGEYTFYGCSSLSSITIPNNVMYIGRGAFAFCSNLKSITIPSSVTTIEESAISGCNSLNSVCVEEGNTKYDSRDNCNGIIETASNTLISGCLYTMIPISVTNIGEYVFYGYSNLTVKIPSNVIKIGARAFSFCSGLTSICVETGNPKYDSRENCNGIVETESNTLLFGFQNTRITNSVTTIGKEAFMGCGSLPSIMIPNSVTKIGEHAFWNCKCMNSITIPNSVTYIGHDSFDGCSSLLYVISNIENPFDIDTNTFNDNTYNNATLYIPAGTIDKYKGTEGWKKFVYIEEGEPSVIKGINGDGTKELKRYTLDGRAINNSKKGINIIQMKDGTTKKVIVK